MNFKTLTTAITLLSTIAVSTTQAVLAANPDYVTVYSSRKEHLIKPLFDAFTNDTGVKVRYLTGKGGALLERIRFEGHKTNADIYMTVDAGNLWYAASQKLFQPLKTKTITNNIPPHLSDPDGLWTGLSVRARTIVYNSDKVSPADLSTYAELATPKWKNRLCLRTSKKIYTKSLVASLIYNHGKDRAGEIISGWVNNLAATPHAKDSHIMNAIATGQCDVGIVNTYYYASFKKKTPSTPLKLFWANQNTTGVHVNISGAGVTKHAPNPLQAIMLIEFLSTPKAQTIYTALNNEFPANPSTSITPASIKWKTFRQDNMNLSQTGILQSKAVRLMQIRRYK
jgi:iron(III) transport system substrate-binding protein